MMKKLMITLVLAISAGFISTPSTAGIIVAKYDLKPPRSWSLPSYVGYNALVENVSTIPGYRDYVIHFVSYFRCNTEPCPVVRLPGPSTLQVTEMYYGPCNAFIVESSSRFQNNFITDAILSDNRPWQCPYPPVAPVGAKLRYHDGSQASFVGIRTYKK